MLSIKARKAVYYALFHCNLIYCIQIWSCASQKLISNLLILQKKAIRIVKDAKYNAHTEPIFKELSILPLEQLIKFFNLQFMQYYIQGFLPSIFDSVWLRNEERRPEDIQRILRNSNQLAVPFTRLVSLSKHPYINLPKTWTDFSHENIKIIRNKIEFKFELKKLLLSQLSAIVTCNRLMCPSCHLNV